MSESPAREALLGSLTKAVKACEIVRASSAAKVRARSRRILALLEKHGALDAFALARAAELAGDDDAPRAA